MQYRTRTVLVYEAPTGILVMWIMTPLINHQHTYSADTLHRGQSALCCKHRAKHSGWNA